MTTVDAVGITLIIIFLLLFGVVVYGAFKEAKKRQQKIAKLKDDLLKLEANIQNVEAVYDSYLSEIGKIRDRKEDKK